jgi:copper chaperone
MTMIRFHLEDMHCGRCEAGVRKAVQAADPAARLQVDLSTRQIALDQSALAPAEWVVVLREAGHEPVLLAAADQAPGPAAAQGCCCAAARA